MTTVPTGSTQHASKKERIGDRHAVAAAAMPMPTKAVMRSSATTKRRAAAPCRRVPGLRCQGSGRWVWSGRCVQRVRQRVGALDARKGSLIGFGYTNSGGHLDRSALWVAGIHSYGTAERSTICVAVVTTNAGTQDVFARTAQSDPQAVPPDHSGLAAKRVVVGVLGGMVVAAIGLGEGASWSVAGLGASDVAALVYVAARSNRTSGVGVRSERQAGSPPLWAVAHSRTSRGPFT